MLSSHSPRTALGWVAVVLAVFSTFPGAAWAGGVPDPGTGPLVIDGGDADTLPDNENQLLGVLGSRRGFGFGDYVSDAISGLQSTLGSGTGYDFFIEIPPGQTTLTVEIFDADTGAGDLAGTEEHDQLDSAGSGYSISTVFELVDPAGASIASVTLPAQDCDPVTVGNQTFCNDAWSDLGAFTVANPAPGHWRFRVATPDSGSDLDDNNSFGIRAHDGDATAGGTEYHVYAESYVGIGQVFAPSGGPFPGFSRTHDFYPDIVGFCEFDSNDWDTDASGDESTTFTPPRPPAGTPATFSPVPGSDNAQWGQNTVTGFSAADDATNYGLWNLRWVVGGFNFITYWIGDGDPATADPALPPSSPGNGAEPNQLQEPGSVRLYFPADGSRFFGERGGPDDVVIAPVRPWAGQSWALLAGEPPLTVGLTSRVRVTVTVANPSALPIQFSAATGGANVVTAQVPTNGGQTAYVAGSATITGGSSTATAEAGAGPWDLTFAPGVVAAGTTATLTYDIDVTPTSVTPPDLFFTGIGSAATSGSYVDGTCADAAGGTSTCASAALPRATRSFGGLCELTAEVSNLGVPALTITKTASAVTAAAGFPGEFQTTFTVTAANSGSTDLVNVQVVDDLTATFPPPATFTVTAGPAATGTLSANGGYDGSGDDDLLTSGSSTLPFGASETITFTVRFDPNGLPGNPFVNTANGSAQSPTGAGVTDSDTANVVVPEAPGINIVKTASALADIGGGQFQTVFTLVVSNTGDVDLSNVQVTDDVTVSFPPPVTVDAASLLCTAGSCGTLTLDYAGPVDTTLLDAAASSLAVGATATLELTVTITPNGDGGPFVNNAIATGQSPQGGSVQDDDSATVSVSEAPAITVVKTVDGAVVDNGDGTFTAPYLVTVTNTGDVELSNVQVVDDLTLTFPAPASVTTVTTPVATGTFNANAGYDGDADTDLLVAATSTLASSASATIAFSVTFDPAGNTGPFTNTADGSGDSPLGVTVQDSDTADVSVTLGTPVIGVAKAASAAVDNGDGTWDVSISIVVENLGGLDLTDVQVTDDLAATFPAPASVVSVTAPVAGISSGTGALTANPAYDGVVDTNLLVAATSTLDIGAVGEITFDITFDPGTLTQFLNSAVATGDSSGGTTTDTSDDGTDPDPDGDGNPDEDGENDPTPIEIGLDPLEIPTLGGWGLLALVGMLAGLGARRLRQRRI
ncbi:MAG: hypothetical protein AAGN66_04950 [Acidobacteriota bacterium]